MNVVVVLLLFALSLPVEVESIERRGLDEEKESQLSQFILLDSDEDQDEPPQHDSAGYLIGQNPLVSKEDYDDLDKEITEEDYEKLDKEIAEEDERDSQFYFLGEDGESKEGYEEFDEENEILMSRSQNGGLNFDEFDEEREEDDEYDTMENEYDTYDERDTIEYDKYGNQILNNSEDYEESDKEESQFYLLDSDENVQNNGVERDDLDKFDDLDEVIESDNDGTEGFKVFSIDDEEEKESSSSGNIGAFGGIGAFGSNGVGDIEYESASYDYEREEEMEEVEALESDIEDTMEEEKTERTVSVETKGVLLPDDTVEDTLNMFDEALCSKSTLMRTSLEDFVSTAALVDGETSLECASDAATLTTCTICNKCTNCYDKFLQLKKEQGGSCDEQSELFKYCGCDACQEEEKVLLACLCPNSAASNLGISLALASILLSILFLN
mmetsp:Transcript_5632/g.6535  ORF Transcript_5632/g.6535 Transcript_5632/m.6535 type:complete len:442 (+) Transcript_5632:178-1503(+)